MKSTAGTFTCYNKRSVRRVAALYRLSLNFYRSKEFRRLHLYSSKPILNFYRSTSSAISFQKTSLRGIMLVGVKFL